LRGRTRVAKKPLLTVAYCRPRRPQKDIDLLLKGVPNYSVRQLQGKRYGPMFAGGKAFPFGRRCHADGKRICHTRFCMSPACISHVRANAPPDPSPRGASAIVRGWVIRRNAGKVGGLRGCAGSESGLGTSSTTNVLKCSGAPNRNRLAESSEIIAFTKDQLQCTPRGQRARWKEFSQPYEGPSCCAGNSSAGKTKLASVKIDVISNRPGFVCGRFW